MLKAGGLLSHAGAAAVSAGHIAAARLQQPVAAHPASAAGGSWTDAFTSCIGP